MAECVPVMDPAMNPYAPPTQDPYGAATPGAGQAGLPQFFRSGDDLVVMKGATLPDVCIVTGETTGGRVQTDTAQWIPPWTIAVLVLIRIVGIILMLVMRKTGVFGYHWSEAARKKRNTGIAVGLGLVGLSVLTFVGAAAFEHSELSIVFLLAGFVMFLTGLILAVVLGRPYQVKKIDDERIYLKVKPAFWSGLQNQGIAVGPTVGL